MDIVVDWSVIGSHIRFVRQENKAKYSSPSRQAPLWMATWLFGYIHKRSKWRRFRLRHHHHHHQYFTLTFHHTCTYVRYT